MHFFCLFQDHIIQTDDINCSSQLKDKFSHMCSVEIITLNLTFVIILAFYRGIFLLLQYLIKIQFVLNLCAYSDSKTVFIGESWLLEKFNRIACLNRKKSINCCAQQVSVSVAICDAPNVSCLSANVYVVRVSAVWLFFRFRCLFALCSFWSGLCQCAC